MIVHIVSGNKIHLGTLDSLFKEKFGCINELSEVIGDNGIPQCTACTTYLRNRCVAFRWFVVVVVVVSIPLHIITASP